MSPWRIEDNLAPAPPQRTIEQAIAESARMGGIAPHLSSGMRRRPVEGSLDYPNARIRMLADSARELHHRLHACAKEPWTVEWIESMASGEVLYDVGACTGSYSLVAASRGVRVFAFEPAYASYARLVEHAAMNGMGELLTPLPIALSSRTGLGLLNYATRIPGGSGHTFWPMTATDEERPLRSAPLLQQWVMSFRADDLPAFDPRILPPVHIKLDVDGAEEEVLEGARQTLAGPGFRSLMMELSRRNETRLLRHAQALGLEMVQHYSGEDSAWQVPPGRNRSDTAYGLFRRPT